MRAPALLLSACLGASAARAAEPDALRWSLVSIGELDDADALYGGSFAVLDADGDGFDDLVVGASGYSNPEPYEGAVFLYRGSAGGLAGVPAWTIEGNALLAVGVEVAALGDVDGDGYPELAVGVGYAAPDGAVDVYRGSAAGLGATPAWSFGGKGPGPAGATWFGATIAGADVNGDGYADMLVGAPDEEVDAWYEGAVHLYLGSAAGLVESAWVGHPGVPYLGFGARVEAAGDVDADGYDDFVVRAAGWKLYAYEGAVWLYRGGPDGPVAPVDVTLRAPVDTGFFGGWVAGGVDVDGDGYDDLVVGSEAWAAAGWEGGAFVYRGSEAGIEEVASITVEVPELSDGYGSVALADVDADGSVDLFVGASGHTGAAASEGRVALFLGSPAGPSPEVAWEATGGTDDVGLGGTLAVGDFNGDGSVDLVAGAPYETHGELEEGRVYVWLGPCDAAADADLDGVGDGCDVCAGHPDLADADLDTVPDGCDACPGGDDRREADRDGVIDGCDPCPLDALGDSDGDGSCDSDDVCPGADDTLDADGDRFPDGCDVCPADPDGLQGDADGDGFGDACDVCDGFDDAVDPDADGVPDGCDVCALGDDDLDADEDRFVDACDSCPDDWQIRQDDADGDGRGDPCDRCPEFDDAIDGDGDGAPDACDLCPAIADDGADADGDGAGDPCDICPDGNDFWDADADGIPDQCAPDPPEEEEPAELPDPVVPPLPEAGGCGCGTPAPRWSGAIGLAALPALRRRRRG